MFAATSGPFGPHRARIPTVTEHAYSEYPPGIPAPPDPGDMAAPPAGKQLFSLLAAYWWVMLPALLLGLAAGVFYVMIATPQYRAECRYEIVVDNRLRISGKPEHATLAEPTTEEIRHLRQRQILILTSPAMQAAVMGKLRIQEKLSPEEVEPTLTVKPIRELDSMIDIQVDSPKASYSLLFLQELLAQYQEVQRNATLQANDNAVRNLREIRKTLADDLERAQQLLLNFQKEHKILMSETRDRADQTYLGGLVQRMNTLKMEQILLETRGQVIADSAGAAGMAAAVGAVGGATWQAQEEWIARLKLEYEDRLATLKPEHPKMVELKNAIDDATRDLQFTKDAATRRMKARQEAVRLQEAALDRAASGWRADLSLSLAEQATYDSLKANVEYLQKQHDEVYSRIITGASQTLEPTLNSMGEAPHIVADKNKQEIAVWPQIPLVMSVSGAAGLLLGLSLSVLLHSIQSAKPDAESIEQQLGIPFLCSIPNWNRVFPKSDLATASVIVGRDRPSAAADTYRSLRNSLGDLFARNGVALGITSTTANEGKSMTVLNLAVTCSWTGQKVLLVDGDLRRGHLHDSFGLKRAAGLTEFLRAAVADWRATVTPTGVDNLFLMPAGVFHATAPELLDGTRLKQFVAEAAKEYDLILFDTAPVGPVVDATLIARSLDAMLLVTRHGFASIDALSHAVDKLKGGRIVGFCLNGVDFGTKDEFERDAYGAGGTDSEFRKSPVASS